jgi:hypothetical protein
MHMRHFWQNVTLIGFRHTKLVLRWDSYISIHFSPSLTWYVCDYTTQSALANTANEYISVCSSHGLPRAASSKLTWILIIIINVVRGYRDVISDHFFFYKGWGNTQF